MEEKLAEITGKSLGEWKTLLAKQSLSKHGEMMNFLKKEHSVTHGFANFIVLKYREADAGSQQPDDLVAQQYETKPTLLPIYQKLKNMILSLGEDIEVSPKKSAVSLRRKRQFALIQPSTKTRIDLGLKYNDTPYAGILEPSGPFGAMCSHRVQITDVSQINDELFGYLRKAYEEAG